MKRAANTNSPEEVRRAMQLLSLDTESGITAASTAHTTAYDHDHYDTAYGWGDHAGLYDTAGTAASVVGTHESTYNHANYNTAYGWGDHAGLYEPLGSSAGSVATHESTYNHTNYDTSYGWGDHSAVGYLTSVKLNEIDDPDGSASISMGGNTVTFAFTNPVGAMAFSMTGGWSGHVLEIVDTSSVPNGSVGDHLFHSETSRVNVVAAHFMNSAVGGVSLMVNDGVVDFSSADSISLGALDISTTGDVTGTNLNISNWDTAYGWGNHAGLYDAAGTAASAVSSHESTYNHANYDTAYGWGNHASAGYLTSQTSHADVVVDGDFASQGIMLRGASAGTYSILTDASANWNTAYGWGDHAGLYQLLGIGGADDATLAFGTGTDYWFVYNSVAGQFEFWSSNVDGAGTDGIVYTIADGTDNLSVKASIFFMDGNRTLYNAVVDGFTSSLFVGNGGQNLSHTAGVEGYYNVGLGDDALKSCTTGYLNVALGSFALADLTSANSCMAIGGYACGDVTTGAQNVGVGYSSLRFVTTGGYNVAIGSLCGRYLADGTTTNTTPAEAVYIGYGVRASAAGATNEIVIGSLAIGNGSNTVTIGSSGTTATYVNGTLKAGGYLSSDGTAGATGTITLASITSITVKNGLITGWS